MNSAIEIFELFTWANYICHSPKYIILFENRPHFTGVCWKSETGRYTINSFEDMFNDDLFGHLFGKNEEINYGKCIIERNNTQQLLTKQESLDLLEDGILYVSKGFTTDTIFGYGKLPSFNTDNSFNKHDYICTVGIRKLITDTTYNRLLEAFKTLSVKESLFDVVLNDFVNEQKKSKIKEIIQYQTIDNQLFPTKEKATAHNQYLEFYRAFSDKIQEDKITKIFGFIRNNYLEIKNIFEE